MGRGILALAWILALAAPAAAITLEFPGPATATTTPAPKRESYALPTGRWTKDGLPAEVIEGLVDRAAWQIDAPKLSSLDLMQPLRAQLIAAGFEVVFECETDVCGGFDFRFAIAVLPEPDMHVDLGDFRFISARKGAEAIGLLVSRSSTKGFVQMTHALEDPGQTLFTLDGDLALPRSIMPVFATPISRLETDGAVVLEGLDFGTGAADLSEGQYASLAALAAWMQNNPERGVALVGHTDASGGLDGNIVVSKRRAASVRTRLIEAYGIPAAQIEAQGVGYLAPIASNMTEEGRQKNRRVEAILTSTQ